MKFSTVICALLVSFSLMAKDAALSLDFSKKQTLNVNGKNITFDGEIIEFDGQKLMAFGEKVYSFPAKGLVGSQGSIVFEFALAPKMKQSKSAARPLLVIRANGREEIGFYSFSKNTVLQYRFANARKNFYGGSKKLPGGKVFHGVMTWDGDKIRCYLNGILIKENNQVFKVPANMFSVNIGPHSDNYYKTHPWPNDTYIKSLRLYNRPLSNAEIAELANIKTNPIHKRYQRVIIAPQRTENIKGTSYVSIIPLRNGEKNWELPPNNACFSYDDKNLYVDFNTIFPPKTSILKGHSANDKESGVWGHESFELHLRHSGKMYYFAGTVNGGKNESLKNVANFNPDWNYKSHIGMQIDDTFLWEGKVAIPWKAIGLNAPPKELKMNFCRSFFNSAITAPTDLAQQLKKGYWAEDEYFFNLKFEKNVPSMRVISRGNPSFGNLEQTFEFISPVDCKAKFYIIQESNSGLLTPQNLTALTLDLKANVPLQKKIQTPLTMLQADRLVYRLASHNDQKIFFQQDVPLKISAEYLSVTPLYYADKLNAAIKTAILKSKFGNAKLTLRMIAPDKKVIFQTSDIKDNVAIPFAKNYAKGSYIVEIVDAKNKLISGRSLFFPGYGEWNDLKFDMTRILPPYQPMSYDRGKNFTAKVVNRDYVWANDCLMPISITSKGEKIINSADFIVNNKAVKGSFKVNSTLKHRAEFKAQSSNSDCRIDSDGWLEFDGVQHNIVKFTAIKNIKNLQLRISMPAKFAKYLHTSACGWSSKITTAISSGKTAFKYYPVTFIGNEEKGLCFFAESNRAWTPVAKPFVISKNDKEAVLTITIAENLKAGQKITFDYGLIGAPVKPMHKRYPLNTASWAWSAQMNRPGKTPTVWSAYLTNFGTLADVFADVPGIDNDSILKKIKNEVALFKANNVRPFTYNPFYTSDEYPEVQAFGNEWETIPRQVWTGTRKNKTHTLFLLCPNSKGADFFLWRVKNFIEKTKVNGINFDFGIVPSCDNNHHGCYGSTPLIAYRNFLRKLAMILIDNGAGEDYVIHIHNTSSVQLPAYTFATHLFNGEHIRQQSSTLMHNGKDILDSYPLAMFASELSSLPFGIYNAVYQSNDVLTKQYGGGKEDPELYKLRITRAFLSGTLLHNTINATNRCHFGIFDKIVRIYDKFNVPASEFIGYWDERGAAKVTIGEGVYASLYKHPTGNKLLAVISHVGNKRLNQDVTVKINPAALKMKNFKSAKELMEADDPEYAELFKRRNELKIPHHRNPLKWQNPGIKLLDFKDNTIKLHLPAHSFALVELQ
ncbi:MAG: hypothetical protein IKA22_08860 [Lentisphaeria bacterium]|nr:hypothetical protein [Lentisphaeria bacterium]